MLHLGLGFGATRADLEILSGPAGEAVHRVLLGALDGLAGEASAAVAASLLGEAIAALKARPSPRDTLYGVLAPALVARALALEREDGASGGAAGAISLVVAHAIASSRHPPAVVCAVASAAEHDAVPRIQSVAAEEVPARLLAAVEFATWRRLYPAPGDPADPASAGWLWAPCTPCWDGVGQDSYDTVSAALAVLARRSRPIRGLCAEDFAHDALLDEPWLLRAGPTPLDRGERPPFLGLLVTALFRARNRVRARRSAKETSLSGVPEPADRLAGRTGSWAAGLVPEEPPASVAAVRGVLDSLPARLRRTYERIYEEGSKPAVAARGLGTTAGTVSVDHVHLKRAVVAGILQGLEERYDGRPDPDDPFLHACASVVTHDLADSDRRLIDALRAAGGEPDRMVLPAGTSVAEVRFRLADLVRRVWRLTKDRVRRATRERGVGPLDAGPFPSAERRAGP